MAEENKTEEKVENKVEEKIEEKPKKEKKKVKVPEKFLKIVKEIEEMKLVDLAELVQILEEKFDVKGMAMPSMMPMPSAATAQNAGANEEKSAYDVILSKTGDKKIAVIKAIKEVTQKGLKECKDMADAADSEPQTVKQGVDKKEAEECKKKLEAGGATVELR